MFPIFRKNLLFRHHHPSRYSSQVRTFLIRFPFSSPPLPHPHPHPHPHPEPHYQKLHEKLQKLHENKVRISVWWDFDDCAVPSGFSALKIPSSIIGALRANGINDRVNCRAYGDVYNRFSKFERTALSLCGIRFRHITDEMKKNTEGKKASDYLFLDLYEWASRNPPPFHVFIICGDVNIDAIMILHWLRMSNYNILVASPWKTYDVLHGATTIMWHWSSIVNGEDLTGKYFNYPPDGSFDSWYGYSKVTLENPFPIADDLTSSQNAEIFKYLMSGEASKVTLQNNPSQAAEEPTCSNKHVP